MKRIVITALMMIFLLSACDVPPPEPSESSAPPSASETAAPTVCPTPAPTATPTPEPTPSPSPTPFGETPDHAGGDDILFDIYQNTALVDLNSDGTPEELEFTAGDASSTFCINGETFAVDKPGLAQLFAVTDVDNTDSILEFAFTETCRDLVDSEKAFTYLYWWNGSEIIRMGGLMDVKFDGAWRSGFHPEDHFDANGTVTCLTRTEAFSDVWYDGHYVCDGASRKLKEDLYVADPINPQPALTLKEYCVLLKKIDSDYFEPEYYVMWDYASGYSMLSRDYADDIVAFIPQAGESLKIVRVYGKYWFKLRASDGKQGWLKCVDKKIQGYYQVMHYVADDIFDGILLAG